MAGILGRDEPVEGKGFSVARDIMGFVSDSATINATRIETSMQITSGSHDAHSLFITAKPSAGAGTMQSCSALYIDASNSSTTPANGYGAYINAPAYGASSKTALYSDNLSIGYTAVTPPTGGALIQGSVAIGSTSSTYKLDVTGGDIAAMSAGSGFRIKEGDNARMGTATLTAGTATVNTTAVTANSRIFLTCNSPGGTPGASLCSEPNSWHKLYHHLNKLQRHLHSRLDPLRASMKKQPPPLEFMRSTYGL